MNDPRVDAYIERAPEYAQPILRRLREAVHAAAPGISETIKWGVPYFEYLGPLCGIAAFKSHCGIGFWKADLIAEATGDRDALERLGHIRSLEEVPPREAITAFVLEAIRLNEAGIARTAAPAGVEVPEALAAALAAHPAALAAFEAMTASRRREYARWIEDAKREETRARRVATAVEWIAEGKPRDWKYLKDRTA
jgi:uncharacterized protein YdeI (YjbR/CyaY-like superfamily)